MSKVDCCIKGCLTKSTSIKVKDVVYYLFPIDDEWAEKWHKRIKEYDPSFQRTPSVLVCSLHFSKSTMHPVSRQLVDHAVPVLFPNKLLNKSNEPKVAMVKPNSNKFTMCCVHGCVTVFDDKNYVPGFRFPRAESRCKLWVYLIKLYVDQEVEPKDDYRICGLHFLNEDFLPNSNKLKETAKPTIFGHATVRRRSEYLLQKREGRHIQNVSSSARSEPNSLMPPPPPLRKSLLTSSKTIASHPTETLLKRPTTDPSQNSISKTGSSSIPKEKHIIRLDKMQKMPGSIQSRRMSLPYTKMPTLVPKPNGNKMPVAMEQPSRQSKSSKVVQASTQPTSQPKPIPIQEQTMPQLKTMPTISARPQSQIMPQLKALPTLSPRPNGPAIIRKIAGGQNVLLYTTPVTRPTTQPSGSNPSNTPPFIVGQPQSLVLPRPQINGKIANRRYSIAVQPTEAVRPMQMNGITSRPVLARVVQRTINPTQPQNLVTLNNGNSGSSIRTIQPVRNATALPANQAQQPANDKTIKVIQTPYLITNKEALGYPHKLLKRILESQDKISELSDEVVVLKKQYFEAVKEYRLQNVPDDVEIIDIT